MGDLFAIALIDAAIIGAAAVGLATAYATSYVLNQKHSLHRPVTQAKGFYAMYAALIAIAATIVLLPGSPLGLLTEGVQVLAGVMLRTPDVTFSQEATVDLGGVTVRLLWFGGAHTKGDELTFVEPDRTLISGDVVQNKTMPNIFGDGGTPAS